MTKKIPLTPELEKEFLANFDKEKFMAGLEEWRPQLEAWGVIPPLPVNSSKTTQKNKVTKSTSR